MATRKAEPQGAGAKLFFLAVCWVFALALIAFGWWIGVGVLIIATLVVSQLIHKASTPSPLPTGLSAERRKELQGAQDVLLQAAARFRSLRQALWIPGKAWVEPFCLSASAIARVGIALVVGCIPFNAPLWSKVSMYAPHWPVSMSWNHPLVTIIPCVAVFLSVAEYTRGQAPRTSLVTAIRHHHTPVIVTSLSVALVAGVAAFFVVPSLVPPMLHHGYLLGAGAGLTVFGGASAITIQQTIRAAYQEDQATRAWWAGKWEQIGLKAEPIFVSRSRVGELALVDTFQAPAAYSTAEYVTKPIDAGTQRHALQRVVDATTRVAVVAAPMNNAQPDGSVTVTADLSRFRVVQFPGGIPPLLDPTLSDEERLLIVDCIAAEAADAGQANRDIAASLTLVSCARQEDDDTESFDQEETAGTRFSPSDLGDDPFIRPNRRHDAADTSPVEPTVSETGPTVLQRGVTRVSSSGAWQQVLRLWSGVSRVLHRLPVTLTVDTTPVAHTVALGARSAHVARGARTSLPRAVSSAANTVWQRLVAVFKPKQPHEASNLPCVYELRFALMDTPEGASRATQMSIIADGLPGPLGLDPRHVMFLQGDEYRIVIGPWDDERIDFQPETGLSVQECEETYQAEVVWRPRWKGVLKQDVNVPTPLFEQERSAKYSNATIVHQIAFVPLSGESSEDYVKFEFGPKLKVSLDSSAAYLSPHYSGQGAGLAVRHAHRFVLRWIEGVAPTTIADVRTVMQGRMPASNQEAPLWIATGLVISAFAQLRYGMPYVYAAQELTVPTSREHVWMLDIDVRDPFTRIYADRAKLRDALRVQFAQVRDLGGGRIRLFVGASPDQAKIAPEYRDLVSELRFERAFMDAKGVVSPSGALPSFLQQEESEFNPDLLKATFTLPSGVDYEKVAASIPSLKVSMNMSFMIPSRVRNQAQQVALSYAAEDPLPTSAPIDVERIIEDRTLAFGTTYDGSPAAFEVKDYPHLLIIGDTGTGKSVTIQSLVTASLLNGFEVVMMDVIKAGADFQCFNQYLASPIGSTLTQSAAIMQAVYAEVVRRKDLNAAYGLPSSLDLPEAIRPKPLMVVIDEFTSLISPKVSGTSKASTLEEQKELDDSQAANRSSAVVASLVGKINREARSAAVTVVLGAQVLKADSLAKIPGSDGLKDQMARVVLGSPAFGVYQSSLRRPYDAPIQKEGEGTPKGRGLIEGSGIAKPFQTWYNSQSEIADILAEHQVPTDGLQLDVRYVEEDTVSDGGPLVQSVIASPVDVAAQGWDDIFGVVENV